LPLEKPLSNPYQILGIKAGASRAEAHAAYRRLARRWHPDLHAGNPEAERLAEEHMKALNQAYRAIRARTTLPPPEAPRPRPPRSPICPRHAADCVHRCRRCGHPACARCLTAGSCSRCAATHARTRRPLPAAVTLWAPVVAVAVVGPVSHIPDGTLAWGVLGYLSAIGATVIGRAGGWTRLLWLGFPYTAVLTGLWHLLKSLG
jgi:hypothetical protein